MVNNAQGHGLQYATGPGNNGVTPPLDRADVAELLAARQAARTGDWPTFEDELDAFHNTYSAPPGWNDDDTETDTGTGKGKGKAR